MGIEKKLSFENLRKVVSKRSIEIAESRQIEKVKYSMHDACLSSLGMMFFQDPSMLEFQRRLQDRVQRNNLQTMFKVSDIPKDNQLRDIIDNVSPEELYPIFTDFFRLLQRGNHLQSYRVLNEWYLIPIDGTQYFRSEKISCPSCLTKKHRNGTVSYSHQALCAAIVHPDKRQVIPLAPEPIKNTDGSKKQDCETNAGKRILERIRNDHPKLKIIITADDLYSKGPFIEALRQQRMSFILIAKPADHKILFQQILNKEDMEQANIIEWEDKKGRFHKYEWINHLRLNGSETSPTVNFFEYTIFKDQDTVSYTNSWVTDIHVTHHNVKELVKAGRAKWKIENENFNTLKNHGYNIEHNFGHGQKNLSFNFLIFILVAFFMHNILELTDQLFKKARAKFSARKEFWNQLRCTIRVIIFRNWESLLRLLIKDSSEIRAP